MCLSIFSKFSDVSQIFSEMPYLLEWLIFHVNVINWKSYLNSWDCTLFLEFVVIMLIIYRVWFLLYQCYVYHTVLNVFILWWLLRFLPCLRVLHHPRVVKIFSYSMFQYHHIFICVRNASGIYIVCRVRKGCHMFFHIGSNYYSRI